MAKEAMAMQYKKLGALAAAAALTAMLAGCVPVQNTNQGQQNTNNTQNQTSSSQEGAVSNPFQGNTQTGQQQTQNEQAQTVDLTVNVDGQDQTVKATVYTGSGYTIAVPEGWDKDHNEPQWDPYHVDDVELTVRYYTGKSVDEIIPLFQRDEDDYTFETPTTTSLSHVQNVTELRGSEMDDGRIKELVTYFIDVSTDKSKACYAIIMECPTDMSQSYGGYLGAMANSFELVTAQN